MEEFGLFKAMLEFFRFGQHSCIGSVTLPLLALIILGQITAGCHDDSDIRPDASTDAVLTLRLSTTHFDFHCHDADVLILLSMAKLLEGNFARITADLRCTDMPRVNVFVYPSVESFHSGVNMTLDEDWFVGFCRTPDSIHIVSPLNPGPVHTYETLMAAVVHEFVHAVFCQVRGGSPSGSPLWLFEGVACWEYGPVPDPSFIHEAVIRDEVPTLIDLAGDFVAAHGYEFSYTLVEYAIDTYGIEAVVRLIRSPSDFEGAFGEDITERVFETRWLRYLDDHYGSS